MKGGQSSQLGSTSGGAFRIRDYICALSGILVAPSSTQIPPASYPPIAPGTFATPLLPNRRSFQNYFLTKRRETEVQRRRKAKGSWLTRGRV